MDEEKLRERLVELIGEVQDHGEYSLYEDDESNFLVDFWASNEDLADHLLANGVTIQRWIPVSEPPKKHGKYLACCENIPIAQIRLYDGEWDSIAKVTHWMPLPTPPKEET